MPSPGEDIQSWSTTAANNGTADPLIVWSEGQARASVNNSSRSEMAAHAKNRNLLNGSIVTTGSANAQQFLSGLTYTSIPTGLMVKLKIGPGLTNDGPATLNMDGLGAVSIKTADGRDVLGEELTAGSYTDLIYNGTNWIFLYSREFFYNLITGGGGLILGTKIFSTAGTFTYTPDPLMECCIIECVGGGGAGGGAAGAIDQFYSGGGGGSGGYSRRIATATDIGASQVVTVGAAGIGSVAASGTSGGNSSVGTLCIALGGGGGTFGAGYAGPVGGVGGGVGTGDIAARGDPGEGGTYGYGGGTAVLGGHGGSSAFGGGAVAPAFGLSAVYSGNAAGNYGSGGSGGNAFGAANSAGGNGSPGIVIIVEFGGRGAPGRDGPAGPIGPPGPAGAGTGDVLVSGIPAAGQLARWVDTSHITGVDAAPAFPAGTAMLFAQAAAPTGWTKSTTHNNKALRVVSGTGGGSGGVQPFTTVFSRTASDAFTLSITEMPAHNHDTGANYFGQAGSTGLDPSNNYVAIAATGLTGGSAPHSHGMDIRVQYVDVLICTKN